jgi:hypothetical protein
VIGIYHAGRLYRVSILTCKPQRAVCVIETDMQVDFAEPLDAAARKKKPK